LIVLLFWSFNSFSKHYKLQGEGCLATLAVHKLHTPLADCRTLSVDCIAKVLSLRPETTLLGGTLQF